MQRYFQFLQPALQTVNGWPLRLHAAQRVGRAQRRVFGEFSAEMCKAARVLVLELHARRADLVGLDRFGGAEFLEAPRHHFGVAHELRALVRIGTIARTDGCQRQRHARVTQAEMNRRVAAHRAADDVRFSDFQMAHDRRNVVGGDRLRILRYRFRHVGRRIAARIEGDAAIAPAEVTDLRFPGMQIVGEFVHEDNRRAATGFFVIELDSVGVSVRHAGFPLRIFR